MYSAIAPNTFRVSYLTLWGEVRFETLNTYPNAMRRAHKLRMRGYHGVHVEAMFI
jgi:hypothetical protein